LLPSHTDETWVLAVGNFADITVTCEFSPLTGSAKKALNSPAQNRNKTNIENIFAIFLASFFVSVSSDMSVEKFNAFLC
jgi:hypothetical protein